MTRCINCKWFESFREAFFGDPFEPNEYGFCRNPLNEMDRAGSGKGCEYFEQFDVTKEIKELRAHGREL